MPQKKRRARRPKTSSSIAIRWTLALLLIALGLILALGAAGFVYACLNGACATGSATFAGSAGGAAFNFTYGALGIEALLLPIIAIVCGIAILIKSVIVSPRTSIGLLFILIAILAFLGSVSQFLGGTVGHWAGGELSHLFGLAGDIVLLIAVALIGLALATDIVALFEALQNGGKTGRRFSCYGETSFFQTRRFAS